MALDPLRKAASEGPLSGIVPEDAESRDVPALRDRPGVNDVSRETDAAQEANRPVGRVELEPAPPVRRRPLVAVMVVVPAFTEPQQGHRGGKRRRLKTDPAVSVGDIGPRGRASPTAPCDRDRRLGPIG